MRIQLSDEIQRDVEAAIRLKLGNSLVVDVHTTAEEIRRNHAAANVALEDIAASLAKLAVQRGCAVEFGGGRADTAA